jgi:hypothetical protein
MLSTLEDDENNAYRADLMQKVWNQMGSLESASLLAVNLSKLPTQVLFN